MARSASDASAETRRSMLALILVTEAMFATRPYRGIIHDAHIYMGRAMADLDPAGVGRDLMFSLDEQTGFSLFRGVAAPLVALAGVGPAAQVLTVSGLLLWSLALCAFVLRLAPGKVGWAAAMAVVALPAAYGSFGSFTYAEPWATPRLFAEAGVLAAMALLLAGRWRWSIACGLAAAAFHPLMALPGVAAAGVWLALRDRRWWGLAAAGAVGLLLAALVGLPIANRLLLPVDSVWLEVLRTRTLYLFPAVWPADTWSRIAVQAATLALAWRFATEEGRRLTLAVGLVAAGGVLLAASVTFFPSLLILQLQPWRALWLVAVAGNASLAITAIGLWRQGVAARIALYILICGWLLADEPAGAGLAWLALAASVWIERRDPVVSRAVMILAGGATAMLAALWAGRRLVGLSAFWNAMPQAAQGQFSPYLMATEVHGLLLAGGAVTWALMAANRRVWRLAPIGGVVALGLAAASTFDARTPFRRATESGDFAPSFAVAAPWVRGPVYWADGDALPWHIARQGAWASPLQGAPALFSRALAVTFRSRVDLLVALGLERRGAISPFSDREAAHIRITPTPQAVQALCRRADAPSAVVLPDRQPRAAPPDLPLSYWTPALPNYDLWDISRFAWRRTDVFTVIGCRPIGS